MKNIKGIIHHSVRIEGEIEEDFQEDLMQEGIAEDFQVSYFINSQNFNNKSKILEEEGDFLKKGKKGNFPRKKKIKNIPRNFITKKKGTRSGLLR